MHGMVVCELRGTLAVWQLLLGWASAASARLILVIVVACVRAFWTLFVEIREQN